MPRVLLDYPWTLDATLDAKSGAFGVLRKFDEFVRQHALTPVPFLEPLACSEALARLAVRRCGTAAAAIRRFAAHCVRHTQVGPLAVPIPEPRLEDSWKRALRDELENANDWRRPQIIAPASRCQEWLPNVNEVPIQCADRPQSAALVRTLVPLEGYDASPYAISDQDPWRHLERLHPPKQGNRINHPCVLPRPPCLMGASLEDLEGQLEEAARLGWSIDGLYYFVPPADYRPFDVTSERWRSGYAFQRDRTKDKQRGGPVDYRGYIWVWDINERHWDVQMGDGYIRVSHDGRRL
jgi:hypothetical protein